MITDSYIKIKGVVAFIKAFYTSPIQSSECTLSFPHSEQTTFPHSGGVICNRETRDWSGWVSHRGFAVVFPVDERRVGGFHTVVFPWFFRVEDGGPRESPGIAAHPGAYGRIRATTTRSRSRRRSDVNDHSRIHTIIDGTSANRVGIGRKMRPMCIKLYGLSLGQE